MKLPVKGRRCVKKVTTAAKFDKRSFRWITTKRKKGALLIGCPKGQWSPRLKKCRVGTRLVDIVLRRKKGRKCEKGFKST